MPVSELVGMDVTELGQRLSESRRELFNLRFQLATGQLDNTARMGQVRREVARILTLLRRYELEGVEGPLPPVEVSRVAGERRTLRTRRVPDRQPESQPEDQPEDQPEAEGSAESPAESPIEPVPDEEPAVAQRADVAAPDPTAEDPAPTAAGASGPAGETEEGA